jgi:SAM-dependent methyltransferase
VLLRDPDWRSERSADGEAKYVAQFVYGQFPERAPSARMAGRLAVNHRIADWFRDALSKHSEGGIAIELGCGPGGYGRVWSQFFTTTILCDIRAAFVEHAASLGQSATTFVCDARDVPLRAGSMSMVAAVNLLDVAPEPLVVLQQIDALLKPRGLLAIALPYAGNFKGPEELVAALSGYEVLESEDWVPWIVPVNDRLVYEYQSHLLLVRKN